MAKIVTANENLEKFNKEYYAEYFDKSVPKIKYPDERVVAYFYHQFKQRKDLKCLDLGCGTGRHSLFMAREGCIVDGIDISQKAISLATDWAKQEGFENKITFQAGNAVSLPYPDESFDFVLESSALEHNTNDDILLILNEINRVLKKGGKLLSSVPGTEHYLYGHGHFIENGAFTADVDRFKGSGLTHFFSREEIYEVFSKCGFKDFEVNYNLTTLNNCTQKALYWYIETQKR